MGKERIRYEAKEKGKKNVANSLIRMEKKEERKTDQGREEGIAWLGKPIVQKTG